MQKDEVVSDAIREAVISEGQEETLETKITAWFIALANGNESVSWRSDWRMRRKNSPKSRKRWN